MLVEDFKFKACIHESCLYYKMDEENNLTLIVQVVDDLIISHKDPDECDQLANQIQDKITFSLNFLGTVKKFNCVDVDQTRNYNYIHCTSYIDKIIEHHKW